MYNFQFKRTSHNLRRFPLDPIDPFTTALTPVQSLSQWAPKCWSEMGGPAAHWACVTDETWCTKASYLMFDGVHFIPFHHIHVQFHRNLTSDCDFETHGSRKLPSNRSTVQEEKARWASSASLQKLSMQRTQTNCGGNKSQALTWNIFGHSATRLADLLVASRRSWSSLYNSSAANSRAHPDLLNKIERAILVQKKCV